MSSQSMLKKAREDNLAMSALLKQVTGERLTTEEKAVIEEFKKARELEARLAEKYDISGAITKALSGRPSGYSVRGLPPQERGVEKAADAPEDLHDAIEKALTPSGRQSHGDATPILDMFEAEKKEPTKKDNRSKTRQDIEQSGIPRRVT
jgi:hypothetical protein